MEKNLEAKQGTVAERFTNAVLKEFSSITSETVKFDKKQKRLAQHLFFKADSALKILEAKRIADGKNFLKPYVWENLNMQKLAIDSVYRIEIGLDALIPNHISMIPYWNKKLEKYDLELQIGYAGKDYYRRIKAFDTPVDIIYELIYSTDVFEPIKKSLANKVESYKFEIKEPFDRGDIIGGFGYILYENENKNKLVIVTEKEFKKSLELAKSKSFWTKNPEAMRYKTIVNRTTDKIPIDPDKMTISLFEVEEQDRESTFYLDQGSGQEKQKIELQDKLKNNQKPIVEEHPAEKTGYQAQLEELKKDKKYHETINYLNQKQALFPPTSQEDCKFLCDLIISSYEPPADKPVDKPADHF